MSLLDKISKEAVPQHIAIIMDGNGRWAKQKGQERTFGHQEGVKAVKDVIEGGGEAGVKYITLYTFSTENWNRPKYEVDALMELLVDSIHKETDTLLEKGIKLLTIGDLESLPSECKKQLEDTVEKTSGGDKLTITLALSYSSRWEIVEATKKIATLVQEGKLNVEDIDENMLAEHLCTAGIPDPELLIRTSGEVRISNYLLWQIAYAELYFSPKLWPDFNKEDLYEAIIDYQKRERRFGFISEQLISA